MADEGISPKRLSHPQKFYTVQDILCSYLINMCCVLEWILFLSWFRKFKLFWVGGIAYGNLNGFVNSLIYSFDIVSGPSTEVTFSKLYLFAFIFLKRDNLSVTSPKCNVHCTLCQIPQPCSSLVALVGKLSEAHEAVVRDNRKSTLRAS